MASNDAAINVAHDGSGSAGSYTLGRCFDDDVQVPVASGRFGSADEVLQEALRLMTVRDRQLAALDAAIDRGLEDERAGRLHDADAVLDELDARYASMSEQRAQHPTP